MAGKKYTLYQAARLLGIPYSERTYTVKQAAQRLRLSDSQCRRLLETGKIKGVKKGRDWLVLSLDYKRKRRPKREADR